MNLTQYKQILRLLEGAGASQSFLNLHDGKNVPPLTEHARCLPDGWTVAPPPEKADGRTITPLFASLDLNTIYCIDENSNEIVVIDPFNPWPPIQEFGDWDLFLHGLYDTIRNNNDDSGDSELRRVLFVNP